MAALEERVGWERVPSVGNVLTDQSAVLQHLVVRDRVEHW